MAGLNRCAWAAGEAMVRYHDDEWGRPQHDDVKLFEFLVLEGAQAGLSWSTILNKREGYREAFAGFDPRRVAAYAPDEVDALAQNPRIVRNRLKIASAVNNAVRFCEIQDEFGSFDSYVWGLVGGPVQNSFGAGEPLPASTPASERLSGDLKRRGFTFVGPIICYAFMQATGMVNDHTTDCFLNSARG